MNLGGGPIERQRLPEGLPVGDEGLSKERFHETSNFGRLSVRVEQRFVT